MKNIACAVAAIAAAMLSVSASHAQMTRSQLKAGLDATILTNGAGGITGAILNADLTNIVSSMATLTASSAILADVNTFTGPSSVFMNTPALGCTGYVYGNGLFPGSCIPTPPSGGLYPVGTSGATLCLLSTNCVVSGTWIFTAGDINRVASGAGNSAGGGTAYNPNNGASLNVYNAAWGVGAFANGNGTNLSTNAAYGFDSLFSASTAGTISNSGYGYNSLYNTNGANAAFNTGIGSNAGRCNTTGSGNLFIGHGAGGMDDFSPVYCTGSDTTAVGSWSGQELTTGGGNALLGMNSGMNLTTGQSNVYLGLGAGACTTSGTATAAGCDASYNVAAGYDAAQAFQGYGLVAIGFNTAKAMTTGARNALGGYQSGYNTVTDNDLTGWGYATLYSLNGGTADSAFGARSLTAATTASNDTASGVYSLGQATTGSWNVADGSLAGYGVVSGNRGIYVGYQAGASGDHSDVIVIGTNVNAPADHSIVIGDAGMTSVKIGPAQGASCAGGTVNASTLTVVYGIVTHC